jgi:hypothetical protein
VAVVTNMLNDSAVLSAPVVGDYKIYEIQRDSNGMINIVYENVPRAS